MTKAISDSTGPAPAAGRPSTLILLVEDEEAVRGVAAKMLERAGYRVLSASSGREAQKLFDEHGHDIALLITDVVMPEMRGPVLAQSLTERRVDLPVLFMSGYSDTMSDMQSMPGRTAFIAKPFTQEALLSTVDELLGTGVNRSPDFP